MTQAFEAYVGGDDFLDCEEDLEVLIHSLVTGWQLEPGEDVAIWTRNRTLAAVIRGTTSGPEVLRFTLDATPLVTVK